MEIAVLSGKGGTGKTTLSTNLAALLDYNYFDLDVEEPNGHIFLKPSIDETVEAGVLVPTINQEKCVLCGACAKDCQFNALVNTQKEIMVFEDLCHGCGTCSISCNYDAITEQFKKIGEIHLGSFNNNQFVRGLLDLNQPLSVPVIKKAKEFIDSDKNNIIDAPPGSSCSVIESVEDSNYAILITEPSNFGLHDLKMVVSVIRSFEIPFGVVINRSNEYDHIITDYLEEENIELIGKIPYSKKAAHLYSKGELLIEDQNLRGYFETIADDVTKKVDTL